MDGDRHLPAPVNPNVLPVAGPHRSNRRGSTTSVRPLPEADVDVIVATAAAPDSDEQRHSSTGPAAAHRTPRVVAFQDVPHPDAVVDTPVQDLTDESAGKAAPVVTTPTQTLPRVSSATGSNANELGWDATGTAPAVPINAEDSKSCLVPSAIARPLGKGKPILSPVELSGGRRVYHRTASEQPEQPTSVAALPGGVPTPSATPTLPAVFPMKDATRRSGGDGAARPALPATGHTDATPQGLSTGIAGMTRCTVSARRHWLFTAKVADDAAQLFLLLLYGTDPGYAGASGPDAAWYYGAGARVKPSITHSSSSASAITGSTRAARHNHRDADAAYGTILAEDLKVTTTSAMTDTPEGLRWSFL